MNQGEATLRWFLKASTTGTTPNEFCSLDSGIAWYTPDAFREQSISVAEARKRVNPLAPGVRVFPQGSVLIVGIGSLGKLAVALEDCSGNQQLNCLVPNNKLDPRFLAYALSTKTSEMYALAGSSTLSILNQERMRSLRIPVHVREEQQRIANFLDEQTARIDSLIAGKERLLNRVRELFNSKLGHAVVSGIPGCGELVPANDKGFEQVREDWDLVPLKYLVKAFGGMTPSKERPEYWDGDIPWVSPKDMKRFVLADSIDHVTQDALASTSLKLHSENSVLIVVRGMILAHTFPVAINAVPVTINQDMKALTPNLRITPKYLAWMLRGLQSLMLALTEESAHGTKALRTDQWEAQSVPVPSLDEQDELVRLFEDQERKTAALCAHLSNHMDRLREYRSSLISAAVTGQIDINNFQLEAARDREGITDACKG